MRGRVEEEERGASVLLGEYMKGEYDCPPYVGADRSEAPRPPVSAE